MLQCTTYVTDGTHDSLIISSFLVECVCVCVHRLFGASGFFFFFVFLLFHSLFISFCMFSFGFLFRFIFLALKFMFSLVCERVWLLLKFCVCFQGNKAKNYYVTVLFHSLASFILSFCLSFFFAVSLSAQRKAKKRRKKQYHTKNSFRMLFFSSMLHSMSNTHSHIFQTKEKTKINRQSTQSHLHEAWVEEISQFGFEMRFGFEVGAKMICDHTIYAAQRKMWMDSYCWMIERFCWSEMSWTSSMQWWFCPLYGNRCPFHIQYRCHKSNDSLWMNISIQRPKYGIEWFKLIICQCKWAFDQTNLLRKKGAHTDMIFQLIYFNANHDFFFSRPA